MTLEYQAAASFSYCAIDRPWVHRSCDQHILVARRYDSSQTHCVGQHGTVEAEGTTM